MYAEREMLLSMIMNLRGKVEELTERLDKLSHGSAVPFIETVEPFADSRGGDMTRSLVKFQPFTSPLQTQDVRSDGFTQRENAEPATLEETERETIRRSLERNGGRRKATAAELNISERTLYRKIKEYGIE